MKKKLKTRFACIRTVTFARNVNVTMFRLMKTVIFICQGRYEGIANIETYRDRQGQTRTDRDRQGQAGRSMDRQGPAGTERECPCLSLLAPACPCLVPACSLHVPGLSLALTGIIGK